MEQYIQCPTCKEYVKVTLIECYTDHIKKITVNKFLHCGKEQVIVYEHGTKNTKPQ